MIPHMAPHLFQLGAVFAQGPASVDGGRARRGAEWGVDATVLGIGAVAVTHCLRGKHEERRQNKWI